MAKIRQIKKSSNRKLEASARRAGQQDFTPTHEFPDIWDIEGVKYPGSPRQTNTDPVSIMITDVRGRHVGVAIKKFQGFREAGRTVTAWLWRPTSSPELWGSYMHYNLTHALRVLQACSSRFDADARGLSQYQLRGKIEPERLLQECGAMASLAEWMANFLCEEGLVHEAEDGWWLVSMRTRGFDRDMSKLEEAEVPQGVLPEFQAPPAEPEMPPQPEPEPESQPFEEPPLAEEPPAQIEPAATTTPEPEPTPESPIPEVGEEEGVPMQVEVDERQEELRKVLNSLRHLTPAACEVEDFAEVEPTPNITAYIQQLLNCEKRIAQRCVQDLTKLDMIRTFARGPKPRRVLLRVLGNIEDEQMLELRGGKAAKRTPPKKDQSGKGGSGSQKKDPPTPPPAQAAVAQLPAGTTAANAEQVKELVDKLTTNLRAHLARNEELDRLLSEEKEAHQATKDERDQLKLDLEAAQAAPAAIFALPEDVAALLQPPK